MNLIKDQRLRCWLPDLLTFDPHITALSPVLYGNSDFINVNLQLQHCNNITGWNKVIIFSSFFIIVYNFFLKIIFLCRQISSLRSGIFSLLSCLSVRISLYANVSKWRWLDVSGHSPGHCLTPPPHKGSLQSIFFWKFSN